MSSVNHFNFISPLDPKVDKNTFYVYFFMYKKLSYLKKIVKKIGKKYNSQFIILTGHKFLQNRIEGNDKTHNYNYKSYRKEILQDL